MTTHLVIGAGPVGQAVVEHLHSRGEHIVVVTRHDDVSLPDGVEHRRANVSDPDAAADAFDGADVVYQCAQPPYDRWPELFPPMTRAIIAGVEAADARLVVAENLYMYGPVDVRLTEDLPYAARDPKGKARAECAELVFDAHEAGRIEATIGRASDFFGPGVRESVVGEMVFSAAAQGKRARVLGDPALPHTYTYVPDFGRALVLLGERDDALGEAWHVPNPETVSTRRFVYLVYDAAGIFPDYPRIISASGWLLSVGGIVSDELEELAEISYIYENPYVVDDSKFTRAFGDAMTATPLEEAIETTLDWYREHGIPAAPIEIPTGEEGESA
ncbi:NAD-dependent epimerase/dehydratase family protein [Haloferax namakaokahaiae]|uniref:NAD-dependent epimerase/dehydratase family protein n=1 Tax=Haloferax namakaokahaiae TaxID=1748331 RepID=A0ABD5ZH98_9EURY